MMKPELGEAPLLSAFSLLPRSQVDADKMTFGPCANLKEISLRMQPLPLPRGSLRRRRCSSCVYVFKRVACTFEHNSKREGRLAMDGCNFDM
jgi:hypothetical protein